MAINVEINKNNNENSASVLRRFVRKVRNAGFLQVVRGRRYYTRAASSLRRKNSALTRIERGLKYADMIKSGKGITKITK